MHTTEKAPAVAPFTLAEGPDGTVSATCVKGRVRLDAAPVLFLGRSEFKSWHEWPENGEGRGMEVARNFHRARIVLSWYDGEEVAYGQRKEHARAIVSGIETVGYVSAIYHKRFVGRDENGDSIHEPGWSFDFQGSYARRASSAFAPALPEGGYSALQALALAIIEQAATPERLRAAESRRLEAIAARERERAAELIQSAQDCQARASALYALAANVTPGPEPCDESEPERIIRQARR